MGPVGAVGANFEPGDFGPLAEDAEEPGMSAQYRNIYSVYA